MFDRWSRRVPEGLAAVPPSPELSAAPGALDPAQVPGDRVVEMLRAQARQCAHAQARLWATMVEVGLTDPADPGGCHVLRTEPERWPTGRPGRSPQP